MTLVPSAPLIVLAHDWSDPVELTPTWPSRVLGHEDGSTQRLALAEQATESVVYRLIAPTYHDAAALKTLCDEATDALVRVPRWEDQARIPDGSSVLAGDSTIPCDPSDKPTFVAGSEVLLWRSPTSYEVAVLDTVGGSSIDVVSPLASGWAAGTIVVPINDARVQVPFTITHWVPTSGALDVTFACAVRDLAGLGTGGSASTGTVASLTLGYRSMPSSVVMRGASRMMIYAVATDSAGNRLANVPVVWSSSDPDAAVWAAGDPMQAIVEDQRTAPGFNTVTVTGTVGAVSGSLTFTVWS